MTEARTDTAMLIVPAIAFFIGLNLLNNYNLSPDNLVLFSAVFALFVYVVFVFELNLIIKWRNVCDEKKN